MKIVSRCLIAFGLLLTVLGLSAIGEPGFDLLQVFADPAAVLNILPLAIGLVMLVVGIAGIFPDTQNAAVRQSKTASTVAQTRFATRPEKAR